MIDAETIEGVAKIVWIVLLMFCFYNGINTVLQIFKGGADEKKMIRKELIKQRIRQGREL